MRLLRLRHGLLDGRSSLCDLSSGYRLFGRVGGRGGSVLSSYNVSWCSIAVDCVGRGLFSDLRLTLCGLLKALVDDLSITLSRSRIIGASETLRRDILSSGNRLLVATRGLLSTRGLLDLFAFLLVLVFIRDVPEDVVEYEVAICLLS